MNQVNQLKMDYKTKINVKLSVGQYQNLFNLITDAYDRGYDQKPRIDTQTFDNLFDAICNAKQTYLSGGN